jgi:quercetin dioxygenase-like cupin family protein
VVEIGPGDVVYFAPAEKHWHGAAPDTFMVHIAINPATNSDGGTDWMEPVTDEQYAGGTG